MNKILVLIFITGLCCSLNVYAEEDKQAVDINNTIGQDVATFDKPQYAGTENKFKKIFFVIQDEKKTTPLGFVSPQSPKMKLICRDEKENVIATYDIPIIGEDVGTVQK